MIASCFKNIKGAVLEPGEIHCAGGWYRALPRDGFQKIKAQMSQWVIKDRIRWDDYCRGCCLLALVILIGE